MTGLAGKIADTFNELVSCNERLAEELERAALVLAELDAETGASSLPESVEPVPVY